MSTLTIPTASPALEVARTNVQWLIDTHDAHFDRCRANAAGLPCAKCEELSLDVIAAEKRLRRLEAA